MPRARARAAVAAVALALAGVSVACGGDDPPSARAVLAQALDAFEARNAAALCDLLSQDAKLVIGTAAHGSPPPQCRSDIRRYFEWLKPAPRPPKIVAVSETGEDRAVARVRLAGGDRVALGLARDGSGWELDGLFDASLSFVQARGMPQAEALTPVAVVPREPPGGASAVVRDAAAPGRPRCPDVRTGRFPLLSGGCVLRTPLQPLDLTLRTPFGTMDFARCPISLELRIDGRGNGWLGDFTIDGSSPCRDVVACLDRDADEIPWRARLVDVGEGKHRLRADVCLDTCVGRFEGDWDIDLEESATGWRLRSAGGIGTTGWRFDGALASRGKPIEVGG